MAKKAEEKKVITRKKAGNKKTTTKKTTTKKTSEVGAIKAGIIRMEDLSISEQVQSYFDDLKEKCVDINLDNLEKSLQEIPAQIQKAEKIGQKFLAEKLKRHIYLIMKEKTLLNYGINKYVSLYDINRFIDGIEDYVVKFCEIMAFPRIIPNEVVEKIEKMKSLGLFSEFYIVFTDYTDEEIISDKAKKQREINRDPIVFGTIDGYQDRYYFIADWVDEYCDITFDKMVNTLQSMDKSYKPKEIIEGIEEYIAKVLPYVEESIEEQKKREEEAERRMTYLNKQPSMLQRGKKFLKKVLFIK